MIIMLKTSTSITKLYFVTGYDGNYYIIRLGKEQSFEVKVPKDTFTAIKLHVRCGLNLSEALSLTVSNRDKSIIYDEIQVLVRKGII